MKKALVTIMFFCLCGIAMAQETNTPQLKMSIGDTAFWKPFDYCDRLGYSLAGDKLIEFYPVHFGEKIEIVAKKAGRTSIIATCSDTDTLTWVDFIITDPNDVPVIIEKPVKPATQEFTGIYQFNPPKDNYFVTINDTESNRKETFMKHGDNEAHNDGVGFDRFWNVKTGKVWYYCPDAQGWTDDVDWEFEPLDETCPALNSFDKEVKDKSDLSKYYVGTEKVLDFNCWHFFVDIDEDTVIQYWVDPANGCTLKRKVNGEPARVVTVYDLNYTKLYFGPSFKKGLHDTRR